MFGKSKAAVLRLPKTGAATGAPAASPAAAPPRPPGAPPSVPGKPPAPGGPRGASKNDDRSEQFYDLKTRIHRLPIVRNRREHRPSQRPLDLRYFKITRLRIKPVAHQ